MQPGGLVSKSVIDGAGRLIKTYTTDGGGDSDWTDADDVTGDKVLEQTAYSYDANGNTVLTTTKQRFHDESGTGELGDPNSTPYARVYYAGAYYDAVNRVTDTVTTGRTPPRRFHRVRRCPPEGQISPARPTAAVRRRWWIRRSPAPPARTWAIPSASPAALAPAKPQR